MKITLKQLKQIIKEEIGKVAPHNGPSFGDTVSKKYEISVKPGVGDGTFMSLGGHEDVRHALKALFQGPYNIIEKDHENLLSSRKIVVQSNTEPGQDQDLVVKKLPFKL